MKNLVRLALIAIFIVAFTISVVVDAAVQIFDGTGQYIMSDFENHDIAKQRAQQRAERDAQKRAGVAIKTFSRSINSELTDDEVSAVMNGIIRVSDVKIVPVPFETNGEAGLMYRATLKAEIDTNGILDWFRRDDRQKEKIISQNETLQDAIQKNDKLIEDLKEKYNRSTSQAEKEQIRKYTNSVDRDFLANQKLEEAKKLFYSYSYKDAIKLCDEALKINPNYAEAYYYRGLMMWSYMDSEQGRAFPDYYRSESEKTMNDFNKAIQLNPNVAAYWNDRGGFYDDLRKYERAIQDYTKAIEINPNWDWPYNNRGTAYDNLGQYERAIQDYNKAIQINPNYAGAYNNLGGLYGFSLHQYRKALKYLNKAIQLNPKLSSAYHNRGFCYEMLGDDAKAKADYAKSKELNGEN